jgi:hypothetical protein
MGHLENRTEIRMGTGIGTGIGRIELIPCIFNGFGIASSEEEGLGLGILSTGKRCPWWRVFGNFVLH